MLRWTFVFIVVMVILAVFAGEWLNALDRAQIFVFFPNGSFELNWRSGWLWFDAEDLSVALVNCFTSHCEYPPTPR